MHPALIGDDATLGDAQRLRLLIVDDSVVTRAVLKATLEQEDEFEIVDCVASADHALLVLAEQRVDVVLLDLDMPGTNGFTALPVIVDQGQGARVLVVSALATEGSHARSRALMLGATDIVAKPATREMGEDFASGLRERVRRVGYAAAFPDAARQSPIVCLAVGASTGGVNALVELLRELPKSFDPPILVTQHLPSSFMTAFAGQLAEAGSRRAVVARDGMRAEPGCIYLAPGDAHLRIARDEYGFFLRLDRQVVTSRCMPSVDPMLTSLGEVCGSHGVGVVLSGMGRDGLSGAAALVAAGGTVMVQDPDSAVVWGMPGAVAAAELASGILSPRAIARELTARGTWR